MSGWHELFTLLGIPSGSGWGWALLDRRADRGHPGHPRSRSSSSRSTPLGGCSSSSRRCRRSRPSTRASRIRTPSGHDAGDDGALQAGGHRSVLLLPADHPAVAVLLRPLPGAQQPAARRGRHPTRRSARSPATWRASSSSRSLSVRRSPAGSWLAGHQHQDPHGRPHRPDVLDDLHHPASAHAQEHARDGLDGAVRHAAEGHPLPDAALLRDLRDQLPRRCPAHWLTTNLWSMGQQFYVIRRMPAPGSQAERDYEERQRRRGKDVKKLSLRGTDAAPQDTPTIEPPKPTSRQRQQPKGKKRGKQTGPRHPGTESTPGPHPGTTRGPEPPAPARSTAASPRAAPLTRSRRP